MNPAALTGDIDTPRPLRAAGGELALRGWCLDNTPTPPPVRLVTTGGTLAAQTGLSRPDVARQFPDHPAGARCGFTVAGRLPAGAYLARFEASRADGTWVPFRTHSLVVEEPPLLAGIEEPAENPARTRVFVSGWALQPARPVTRLAVRYGHQEIPCRYGLARDDVPAQFPGVAHARPTGFKTETILSAGHGRLRLRAEHADGSVSVTATDLTVDIPTDENHPPGFDFHAARIGLPGARRAPSPPPPAPPAAAPPPRRILFILPGSFAANSALHVAALANELAAAGHDCAVAVAHDVATVAHHAAPRFRAVSHADTANAFADKKAPDVVHAWTTRENVRRLATALHTPAHNRLVVHLEDNEPLLLALTLQRSTAELAALPEPELDRLVPADLSHPRRSREFLARADGVTVVTDRLREFVPPGKPCHTIRPAADARYFHPRPIPADFRRLLDFAPDTTVLFYHGNGHAANAAEMRELYAAVARLNDDGVPVTLIRTGRDSVDFLGAFAAAVRPHVVELGQILHHRHLPDLMALADIFVQPGAPDAFNDYRFPSKLPEFFALGRPVVLPRTNLGAQLRHGVDAYVLERADAAGIAAAVRALRADRALADRLGRGAAEYAAAHFSWPRAAAGLASFYGALAAS